MKIRYIVEFECSTTPTPGEEEELLKNVAENLNQTAARQAKFGSVRFSISRIPSKEPHGRTDWKCTHRSDISRGDIVDIVLKQDQPTGALTRGQVARILTKSCDHPRGIKVELTDGQIGRVQAIIQKASDKG